MNRPVHAIIVSTRAIHRSYDAFGGPMSAARPQHLPAVRKRSVYTRMREKRSCPKTPAPKDDFLIAEL
jgi:hypothetical protein